MNKDKIIEILTELRPEFDFSEQVDFIEEGMLDSFDIVSLVDELESQFNIKINGVDVIPENFSSVDSIIALLNKNGAA
jgi:acyl carrier protein